MLALIAWLPCLNAPFVFDDYNVIVSFSPAHSFLAWWQHLPAIRPLLKLSYVFNWQLSQQAFIFHATNLLIHLFNTGLGYVIVRRLWPQYGFLASWIALVWCLHPVQTEAISYISGRSIALSSTCLLLALYLITKPLTKNTAYLIALICLVALLIKETSWIFPIILAMILWLRGETMTQIKRLLWPSFIVIILTCILLVYFSYYQKLLIFSLQSRSFNQQLLAQSIAYPYFVSVIFSLQANIDPDLITPSKWQTQHWLTLSLLLSIGVFSLWRVCKYRCWWAGAMLWFLCCLMPSNSIIPRLDIANDRHLYLALWSVASIVVISVYQLLPRTHIVVLSLSIFVLAWFTLVRNMDYQSEVALWLRTTEQSPNKSRVWNNLGVACQQQANIECAEYAFLTAVKLDPNNLTAANNLYFLPRLSKTKN